MTTLKQMIGEAELDLRERVQWANNLERAILMGHVKREVAEVRLMRMRHPDMAAVVRALEAVDRWRDRLPPEFIADLERDPT